MVLPIFSRPAGPCSCLLPLGAMRRAPRSWGTVRAVGTRFLYVQSFLGLVAVVSGGRRDPRTRLGTAMVTEIVGFWGTWLIRRGGGSWASLSLGKRKLRGVYQQPVAPGQR